jgi:hypothetical protein
MSWPSIVEMWWISYGDVLARWWILVAQLWRCVSLVMNTYVLAQYCGGMVGPAVDKNINYQLNTYVSVVLNRCRRKNSFSNTIPLPSQGKYSPMLTNRRKI